MPNDVAIAWLNHIKSYGSEEGQAVVEAFWQNAVARRSEGMMVKLLDNAKVIESHQRMERRG